MDLKISKGTLYSAIGAMSWGLSGVCSQMLFESYGLDSGWMTAIRMVCSGFVLLCFAAPFQGRKLFQVFHSRRICLWLIGFAFFGLLLCQYCYLSSIAYSNSATGTVLQSLNVIMMACLMAGWHRTPIGKKKIAALFLAVFGTFLIATHGNPGEMILSGKGLFFGLCSAVGVITYTLLSRPVVDFCGNVAATGWGMLIGGIVFTTVKQAWHIPPGLDGKAFLLLGILILIGTAGGFSIYLQGVKYIGPEKATLIGCLEPATATVLSAMWLDTQFGFLELCGFACILVTVFLSSDPKPLKKYEKQHQNSVS